MNRRSMLSTRNKLNKNELIVSKKINQLVLLLDSVLNYVVVPLLIILFTYLLRHSKSRARYALAYNYYNQWRT